MFSPMHLCAWFTCIINSNPLHNYIYQVKWLSLQLKINPQDHITLVMRVLQVNYWAVSLWQTDEQSLAGYIISARRPRVYYLYNDRHTKSMHFTKSRHLHKMIAHSRLVKWFHSASLCFFLFLNYKDENRTLDPSPLNS